MKLAVAACVLAALAQAGCPPRPTAPAPPPADLVTAVKGTIEQWRQAFEIRSMDALSKLYAHDPALTIVQGGAFERGWAAIEPALRARVTGASAIHVRIADVAVAALGPDGAVASATMTRESSDGATTVTENGVVTIALRRDDPGWVIVSEHYSYKQP